MLLLSRVLEHRLDRTVCAVEVGPNTPFVNADGKVPPWIGVEYMAQCVAAHAGLQARANGGAPRLGVIVGSRRLDFRTDAFHVRQHLIVDARKSWGDKDAAVFTCHLIDAATGACLVEGSLNVVLSQSGDRFLPPPRI